MAGGKIILAGGKFILNFKKNIIVLNLCLEKIVLSNFVMHTMMMVSEDV